MPAASPAQAMPAERIWSTNSWCLAAATIQERDEPKTKHSRRTVYLAKDSIASLAEHRRAQALERPIAGPLWKSEHDFVFATPASCSAGVVAARRGVLHRTGRTSQKAWENRHCLLPVSRPRDWCMSIAVRSSN